MKEKIIKKLEAQIELYKDNEIYLNNQIERLQNIIKEVREYITSFQSIETIQQTEHPERNKGLEEKTFIEIVNRYMEVHHKLLEILDKENS